MVDGGFSAQGLVLSLHGLIDLCIKYGEFLQQKVALYRQIDEVVRLDRFLADLLSGELHTLLQFFLSVNDQMTMNFRNGVHGLFQVLRDTLERLSKQFPPDNPGVVSKLGFSFSGKRHINKAIEELEQWHTRFLRRAIVVLFFGGCNTSEAPAVVERSTSVMSRIRRIREAFVDSRQSEEMLATLRLDRLDTKVSVSRIDGSGIYNVAHGRGLIEYRTHEPDATRKQISDMQSSVRDLSARLNHAAASESGLLHCNGFSGEPIEWRFALHFEYPAGKVNPRTLHRLLTDPANSSPGIRHSKTDRIVLARRLASAVLYLHSANFVHKNIRPSNILVFDNMSPEGVDGKASTYPNFVGEPYLFGFDAVRKADARSSMIRVEEWQKNIYLHPDRHRMKEGDEFTMRHDTYSLGVVLLEIALWGSFTDLGQNGIGKLLWDSLERGNEKLRPPERLKQRFIALARSQVPRNIGDLYARVVVSCLEGLEDEEYGGLLSDQDGIVVGAAYISQVMGKLEEIRL